MGSLPFCPQPKSKETRKRIRGRKQRAEAKVKRSGRAACVERDGHCRAFLWFDDPLVNAWGNDCRGRSTWAHIRGHRRSQTRGQAPEIRHSTATSMMLCERHHGMEERGEIRVVYLTDRGCDGAVQFVLRKGKR